MRYTQQLFTGLSADEVNNLLDNGAKLVWVTRDPDEKFTAAFEMSAPEPELDAAAMVTRFLNSVAPSELEKAMLEAPEMDLGVAEAALVYLHRLVRSRVDGA